MGEIVEKGDDVKSFKIGDKASCAIHMGRLRRLITGMLR